MGFVPAGAASAAPLPLTIGATSITYGSQLALPYSSSGQHQFEFAPNIAANYTFVRAYAGKIAAYSTGQSAGTQLVKGTFSAAAVTDTRDIARSADPLVKTTFGDLNIRAASTTTRDYVANVPTSVGVVALQACDISKDFTPPERAAQMRLNGEHRAITAFNTVTNNTSINWGNDAPVAMGVRHALFGGWVTPWDITLGAPPVVPPYYEPHLQTPPINECGDLTFDVQFQGFMNSISVAACKIECDADYVFATCNESGSVNYTVITAHSQGVPCASPANVPPPGNQNGLAGYTFRTTCPGFGEGMTNRGKFIGACVTVYASTLYSQLGVGAPLTFTFTTPIKIEVGAPTIDLEGELGPARILRWDDVTAAQQVTFEGKLRTQAVANAALQPFVKGGVGSGQLEMADWNAFQFLQTLYNSNNSFFRRVYALQNYINLTENERNQDSVTNRELAQIAGRDDQVKAHGEAAGLFGSLLGSLKSAVGSAIKNVAAPVIGDVVRAGMGAIGHAGGQFGYEADAGGQFGYDANAGGQFGYGANAGGHYGCGMVPQHYYAGSSARF